MRRTLKLAACLVLTLSGCGKEQADAPPPGQQTEPKAALTWQELPALPDPLGFGGPFAGVSRGALIVAGGAHFPVSLFEGGKKVWRDYVFVLEPGDKAWLKGLKLTRPLAYGASVSVDDKVVLIGGCDAEQHYADVQGLEWVPHSVRAKPLRSLPKPCAYTSAALIGKTIYVAGGQETPTATAAMRSFWALDLSKPEAQRQWAELEPWPGPARILPVAAASQGKFYLFTGAELYPGEDGKAKRKYLKDTYRYDPRKKAWTKLADLPRPAVAAPTPAMVVDGRIFVCSGDDGANAERVFELKDKHPGFFRTVLAYDVKTDTWSEAGEMPKGHVTTCSTVWQGVYIVPSGEIRPGVRSPKVCGAKVVE